MATRILYLCFLLAPIGASAQKLYPVRERIDSMPFRLVISAGRMALERDSHAAVFQPTRDFPQVVDIQLEDGDLVVSYQLGRGSGRTSYQLAMNLLQINREAVTPPSYVLREQDWSAERSGLRRLAWLDFAENWLQIGQEYTLVLRRSQMGIVNCSGERPVFSLRKQLPHFAGAGAGIALAGLGAVYRHQSDKAYENYRNSWVDGRPKNESSLFLNEAQKQNRNSRICSTAGWALLGASMLWYGFRQWKIRRAQRNYDQYCAPSTSLLQIAPAWYGSDLLKAPAGPGLAVQLTF